MAANTAANSGQATHVLAILTTEFISVTESVNQFHPIMAPTTAWLTETGNPYFVTGAHSANMSATKLDSNQSCVSRRSIVGVQGGVLYASPDGLCLASGAGVQVVTRQLIARVDWQKLQPASMFAAEHEGVYYLFYAGAGGGCLAFSIQDGMKLGHIDLTGSAVWASKIVMFG